MTASTRIGRAQGKPEHAPDRSISLHRIGLGCAALGQPRSVQSDDEATRVIAAAYERGIRTFDAAPLYGGGLAEERLGQALKGVPRDQIVLSTKVGVERPFGQGPIPPGGAKRREADIFDYRPEAIRRSVERSLERLGTNHLDYVHLHDVDDHVDAASSGFSALADMRSLGMIGSIGVGSNAVGPIEVLLARIPLDAILIAGRLTLLDQSGRDLIARASARDIKVLVGGVFNSGILGRWPRTDATFFNDPAGAAIMRRTELLAGICEAGGVSLRTAALQFPLRNDGVSTALIGPSSVKELDQNLADLCCEIPEQLWRDLGAAGVAADIVSTTDQTA